MACPLTCLWADCETQWHNSSTAEDTGILGKCLTQKRCWQCYAGSSLGLAAVTSAGAFPSILFVALSKKPPPYRIFCSPWSPQYHLGDSLWMCWLGTKLFTWTKTQMTYAVYWRKAPLQNMAVGTQGTSHTPRNDQQSISEETTRMHTSSYVQ